MNITSQNIIMPSLARVSKSFRREHYCELNVLFYLVVYYYEVVEVLDLGTLYHDGFTDMHILCVCPADNKTAFKSSCCAGSVVNDIRLDYAHSSHPP